MTDPDRPPPGSTPSRPRPLAIGTPHDPRRPATDIPGAPHWLTEEEARAWRGYRRLFLLLNRQITRDLARDSGLSEPDYDVLSALSEAPDSEMRLTELARHMRWSKSRLSHHLTRMEQRGLVARRDVPTDARGAAIALTPTGRTTIQQAAPPHVDSVRRHFIDLLTPDQVTAFADLSWHVIDHLLEADPD